jgi:hypothetical protein
VIDDKELARILLSGSIQDSDIGMLEDLCDVVYKQHFTYTQTHKDDLIQEGLTGIIQVVDSGNFDPEKGSAFNFIYTKVRNSMSNYLYHNNNSVDVEDTRIEYTDCDLPEGLVAKVVAFIEGEIKKNELHGDLARCVKTYFYDKLGVQHIPLLNADFSYDFVQKYKHYVNLISFRMHMVFMGTKVVSSSIDDIIAVFEAEGVFDFRVVSFLETLSYEQKLYFLYVLEGVYFEMPNKEQLFRVDDYLSIYKRLKHKKHRIESVAYEYDRPVQTVLSILENYDIIFNKDVNRGV